jgi:hypothetical protein
VPSYRLIEMLAVPALPEETVECGERFRAMVAPFVVRNGDVEEDVDVRESGIRALERRDSIDVVLGSEVPKGILHPAPGFCTRLAIRGFAERCTSRREEERERKHGRT